MTKWQRFGDGTWVNVDQVEVLRIEEQDDGRWQLTAQFASGQAYPVGCHEDRQLLVDCTDALIRGEVGERLRAWTSETAGAPVTETAAHAPTSPATDEAPQPAAARWWRFRRSQRPAESSPIAALPEPKAS